MPECRVCHVFVVSSVSFCKTFTTNYFLVASGALCHQNIDYEENCKNEFVSWVRTIAAYLWLAEQ